MPDIKIFVSNRIDINSVQVENPVYMPIACGAVFSDKGLAIQGDNTGDNISELRNMLGEFTVQYWAWKNMDIDYYGLCHYRRYLIFSDKHFRKAKYQQMCQEAFLDRGSMHKYGLDNEKHIRDLISRYDVIVNESVDVSHLWTPQGIKETVYEHWAAQDGIFINKQVLPVLLEMIKGQFPQYYTDACEYMNGRLHRGYNCYVMKRKIFHELNKFQFSILFSLKKMLTDSGLWGDMERTLGYCGEIMYGIYIYHLKKQGKYKIKELQLVYFEHTVLPDNKISYLLKKTLFRIKEYTEEICYVLFPKGSARRKCAKNIYFSMISDKKK